MTTLLPVVIARFIGFMKVAVQCDCSSAPAPSVGMVTLRSLLSGGWA